MTGLRTDRREVLVTSIHDAEPESRHEMPEDSIWPLLLALAVGGAFIGAVYAPIGLLIGTAFALPLALGWAWPDKPKGPAVVDTVR
jgi:cytochrome c oxidase subunit 1